MARILGSPGRTRRVRSVLALASCALLFALWAAPSAQAVHDLGAFELEGDATNDPALPGDDWDNVCREYVGSDCSTTDDTSAFGGANDVSFVEELDRSASIFTGGGSKDPEDISAWAWKNGGGLPDKDNLLHAFAARYQVPQNDTTSCPTSIEGDNCDVLYFGSDRFDNSGDAVQGFWFLQDEVSLGDVKSGGGFNFEGLHTEGDLLVLSDFSNGGTVSTINVYKWVESGGDTTTHLDFLAGAENAKCADTLVNDPFCGIVNPDDGTDAPWSFTDKSGNDSYLQGEFFEAGINLSSPDIDLAGECFATLVAESRSSTSPTATLKDFVLGPFGECEATMTTDASTNSLVLGSGSVTDSATVTTNPGGPAPTGNVDFYVCGPSDGISSCDAATGTFLSSEDLAGATGTPPEYTVTSDAFTPTAVGDYCFFATWAGDSNYIDGASVTDFTDECFTVTDTSSASTVQDWLPNDTATITSAGGSNLTGTVIFDLYESADCTGTSVYHEEDSLSNATSPAVTGTANTTEYTGNVTVSWKVSFDSTASDVSDAPAVCETSSISGYDNDVPIGP